MSHIESRIVYALKHFDTFSIYSGSVVHDKVSAIITSDEYCNLRPKTTVIYRLLGTVVAKWDGTILKLGVNRAAWQTKTTKSRINAIAQAFGVVGVYQKDFTWIWTDGLAYDNPRSFFFEKEHKI